MARYGSGEAERLQRPVPVRQSSPARPASRVPTASRLMFAVGMLSLIAALALWLLSGSEPDSSAARPLPAPATQALPAPPAQALPAPPNTSPNWYRR